jgi:hypothetical protein
MPMTFKVHHVGDHKTLVDDDGTELVSIKGAANTVGCSVKTILRAEADRRIAKPERTIPNGMKFGRASATRFYSPAEVAAIAAVLKPHGDQQTVNPIPVTEPPPPRPWLGGGHRETEPRQRPWAGIQDPEADVMPLAVERCPDCGSKSIVWSHDQVRGARPTLLQHAYCEKCQREVSPVVEFSPPPQRAMIPDRTFVFLEPGLPTRQRRRRGLMLGDMRAVSRTPKPTTSRPPGILPPLG